MLFGFDEGTIIGVVALLFFSVLAYFYCVKFRRKKIDTHLYFFAVVFLLFMIFLISAKSQPYHPLSIFLQTAVSLFVVGLFLFWFFSPFGDTTTRIIDREGRIDFLNIFVVLICYFMLFSIVHQGMSSLLGSITTPRSIELTPEFGKFFIPSITAILLVSYRVSKQIHSTVWSSINTFCTAAILAALAFFIFASGARFLGLELSRPLGLTGLEFTIWVLVVAIGGVLFEWFLYHFNRGLRKYLNRGLSGYHPSEFRGKSVLEIVSPITMIRLVVRKERKQKRAQKPLHKKVKKDIFKKHPRLMTTVTIALFLAAGMQIYILSEKVQVKALVPTFSADIQIVNENELPPEVEIFTADELEGISITSFAIRLVHIETKSITFFAPDRDRYHLVESEEFKVTETGEYLLINLNEGPAMEKTFLVSSISPGIDYNQTRNSEFSYLSRSGDAEIYYCLHISGYNNLNTFSSSGRFETQKTIYATEPQRDNTIIKTQFTKQISIITLNTGLSDNIEFLLEQTKLMFTVESTAQEPEMPTYIISN